MVERWQGASGMPSGSTISFFQYFKLFLPFLILYFSEISNVFMIYDRLEKILKISKENGQIFISSKMPISELFRKFSIF